MHAIGKVLRQGEPTIACTLWRVVPDIASFAVELSLLRAGAIENLPLNAKIAVIPLSTEDIAQLEEPSQGVLGALELRKAARVKRSRHPSPGDLKCADWEYVAERGSAKVRRLTLPPISFVAVDLADSSGGVLRGHRPVLGRYARAKRGVRPSITSVKQGSVTRKTLQVLAESDLIILNAQLLRSRRSRDDIRKVLHFSVDRKLPTLLLIAGPGDLLFLDLPDLQICPRWLTNTASVTDSQFRITVTCQDRLAAERSFEFAVRDLEAGELAAEISLGKAAWWAKRGALTQNQHPLVSKFNRRFDDLLIEQPLLAGRLTGLHELLNNDSSQPGAERLDMLINKIEESFGKSIFILVRDMASAQELKQALAARLAITSLEEHKISIRTPNVGLADVHDSEVSVSAGYFGMRTLDLLLAAAPSICELILDPLEVRIAAAHVREMHASAIAGECTQATTILHRLEQELSKHVIGFSDDMLDVGLLRFGPIPIGREGVPRYVPNHNEVGLCFSDGTRLDVARNARFEMVGDGLKRLKAVAAADLKSGDQVIILDESSRSLYSDLLLEALDNGPLKGKAEQRDTWLTIVQSLRSVNRTSVPEIARRMSESGSPTDPVTIRTWLRSDKETAAVPDTFERFVAFSAALGISAPADELSGMYESIRSWRRAHRLLGRELARAIKAAYVGRLSAASLQRIERNWGLGARELVESARIGVIEEVIVPGEVNADAAI